MMISKKIDKNIEPIALTEVQKIRQELKRSLDLAKKQAFFKSKFGRKGRGL